MYGKTFCIGSITVARPLERNLGKTLAKVFLAGAASALDEDVFNIIDVRETKYVAS